MPSHYGFGSATAIRLGVLEAISKLQSQVLERERLVSASGRGGTSGIGVTTYFDGGLVFGVGTRSEENGFAPSSSVEGQLPSPLVLVRFPMPNWQVGVCIPSAIRPQTVEQEAAFFKRVCPISAASVHQALYHVIYGLVASAREQDLPTFGRAVRSIQDCVWKRNERELYGDVLVRLEQSIYDAGASAVGLSSLGPGLFFLGDSLEGVVAELCLRHPQHTWYSSACWNSGRTIMSE
jgi:beta-ribofuranosylaminobenzene 5'-phosphate synthase